MKTIIVYQSSTGFTKQYAQWIKEELQCEAVDIKKLAEGMVSDYDCIIYGGWVMGNTIVGLDKIRKSNPKQLVVFAVGSTPDSEDVRHSIQEVNQLGDMPFFYLVGGFRFDKLNFMVRTMLKVMKKSVVKKENKTVEEEFMAKALGTSFDHSDQAYIKDLVDYIEQLEK